MNPIDAHCLELDRCNQRGGRMLSIVDLLDAGTVDLSLAGYLMAAVQHGASFLVGALPGGAGKTTVMAALLNLLPNDVTIVPTDATRVLDDGLARAAPPLRCYVCHEIGSGPYYAYLWGEDARRFFRLPSAGHTIATNLHADTFDQCRDQLCHDNRVPEADVQRCTLMLFLAVEGAWGRGRRRVATVYESTDGQAHRLTYRWDRSGDRFEPVDPTPPHGPGPTPEQCAAWLDELRQRRQRTIEQVRRCVVAWTAPDT